MGVCRIRQKDGRGNNRGAIRTPGLVFGVPACVQFVGCAGMVIGRKLGFPPWQEASPNSSPRAARGL